MLSLREPPRRPFCLLRGARAPAPGEAPKLGWSECRGTPAGTWGVCGGDVNGESFPKGVRDRDGGPVELLPDGCLPALATPPNPLGSEQLSRLSQPRPGSSPRKRQTWCESDSFDARGLGNGGADSTGGGSKLTEFRVWAMHWDGNGMGSGSSAGFVNSKLMDEKDTSEPPPRLRLCLVGGDAAEAAPRAGAREEPAPLDSVAVVPVTTYAPAGMA